jgi:hypothetical protein
VEVAVQRICVSVMMVDMCRVWACMRRAGCIFYFLDVGVCGV